jgi:hypothetical membrane protein
MFVPSFQSCLLFVLTLLVIIFDVWLFAFSVKIFAEKIQNGVDAFVGVMLSATLELLGVFAEDTLKHVGSYNTRVHIPHFVYRFSIGQNKTTLGA